MKVLNLVNIDKSDIKWELSSFPDGQQNIKILDVSLSRDKFWHNTSNYKGAFCISDQVITIKARLNNFSDLEKIICANQSLKVLGVNEIHLEVPYFLGSRSDRQFSDGENNYLKHVICPLVNLQGFKSVTVLDPHSDVLEACLNGFKKVSNEKLVKWAVDKLDVEYKKNPTNEFKTVLDLVLISPDAGATKKIYKVQEMLSKAGAKLPVFTCTKNRGTDGRITSVDIPIRVDEYTGDFIIIDDICDGGGTFLPIGQQIKKLYPDAKVYLIVTHGIFSKGFTELNKYFDNIYCTNSYRDIPTHEWDGDKKDIPTNVKQLNIF